MRCIVEVDAATGIVTTRLANELTDSYRSILKIIAEEKAYEQIAKSNVRGTRYRYYNYYGSRYGGYSTSSARKAVEKRNRAEGAKQVKEKLSAISTSVRNFRQQMSLKYNIDF